MSKMNAHYWEAHTDGIHKSESNKGQISLTTHLCEGELNGVVVFYRDGDLNFIWGITSNFTWKYNQQFRGTKGRGKRLYDSKTRKISPNNLIRGTVESLYISSRSVILLETKLLVIHQLLLNQIMWPLTLSLEQPGMYMERGRERREKQWFPSENIQAQKE